MKQHKLTVKSIHFANVCMLFCAKKDYNIFKSVEFEQQQINST